LGNHIQLQPLITRSADGTRAQARVRMLQQMSLGARASIGSAIYENEFVKEDGVWKFSKLAAYNTLSASYRESWTQGAGRGMPGASREFPPDSPPTREVAMFPLIPEIPYHYENPVSGSRDWVRLPPIAEQLRQFPMPTPQ
jgi:hypothetical protein